MNSQNYSMEAVLIAAAMLGYTARVSGDQIITRSADGESFSTSLHPSIGALGLNGGGHSRLAVELAKQLVRLSSVSTSELMQVAVKLGFKTSTFKDSHTIWMEVPSDWPYCPARQDSYTLHWEGDWVNFTGESRKSLTLNVVGDPAARLFMFAKILESRRAEDNIEVRPIPHTIRISPTAFKPVFTAAKMRLVAMGGRDGFIYYQVSEHDPKLAGRFDQVEHRNYFQLDLFLRGVNLPEVEAQFDFP